jgi:hypothetical protein
VRLDDFQHAPGAERPDQLAFEIGVADEDLRERAAEAGGLARVDEPDEPRALVPRERAPDRLGASDRLDRDALRREVVTEAAGERLDRDPVARALDQNDGAS